MQASQAEKNRTAAAAKYKKDVIKEQQLLYTKFNFLNFRAQMKPLEAAEVDAPMRIYVGGLDQLEISENDIREIFNFGDIDYIELQKDENTMKVKGYVYIQFRKSSQAKNAIRSMNNFNYNGKNLKVIILLCLKLYLFRLGKIMQATKDIM